MKTFNTTAYLALTALLTFSCADKKLASEEEPPAIAAGRDLSEVDAMIYANTITVDELEEQLYYYASDDMKGRDTGKPGQKMAVEYLKQQYIDMGVRGGMPDGDFFQPVPGSALNRPALSSENVLAFIEGTELPEGDSSAFCSPRSCRNGER